MATVKTGEDAGFDFIVAGEDFSLHCSEEYPHGGNITFTGSDENAFLQSRFMAQAVRRQKTELLVQVQGLYDGNDAFGTALLHEIQALSSGALPAGKILLVFYESGCGHCENEIQQLIGNYSYIRKKGYEVLSVSADIDPQVYRNLSDPFPWKGRYCNFEGFSGTDF